MHPRAFRHLPRALYRRDRIVIANPCRQASSASSKRWQARQSSDKYAKEAVIQGLKSRAAFKLLEV